MPLLKESRLNHLGKLMFQWFYWHACCPDGTSPASAPTCPPPGKDTPTHASNPGGLTMPTKTVAGTDRRRERRGLLHRPDQWTEAMAARAGRRRAGIDELTDQHWTVIRFMRNEYFEKGTGPTVRVLGKTSGVSVKELYQLFPKGPAKIAARIAGIPKPRGCI
jgi:TusE/DsrC/DsvC family sulfur relay protein